MYINQVLPKKSLDGYEESIQLVQADLLTESVHIYIYVTHQNFFDSGH